MDYWQKSPLDPKIAAMAAGSFKTKEPAEMAIIMFFRIFEFRPGIFPGSIFLSGFGCLPDQPEINRWNPGILRAMGLQEAGLKN